MYCILTVNDAVKIENGKEEHYEWCAGFADYHASDHVAEDG